VEESDNAQITLDWRGYAQRHNLHSFPDFAAVVRARIVPVPRQRSSSGRKTRNAWKCRRRQSKTHEASCTPLRGGRDLSLLIERATDNSAA
jgi:hypothetical protein